jgi:hypothetical protein
MKQFWSKRRAMIGATAVVLLTAVCFGGYSLYQNHISSDVRHLLIAASDEHASETDVRQYILQVRPLVRTMRDKELVEEFENAMTLIEQIEEDKNVDQQEADERKGNEMRTSLGLDASGACAEEVRPILQEFREASNAKLKADLRAEAFKEIDACFAQQANEAIARLNREGENWSKAHNELNRVRSALGMPLLPNK